MAAEDPERRRTIASLGAHELHAQHSIAKTTKAGRKAAEDRLDEQLAEKVDPRGTLRRKDPTEFQRRMAHAHSAHFKRLAPRAVAARKKKSERAVGG